MSAPLLPPMAVSDPAQFGKVAVLMGGWSAERELSLRSGAAVLDALRQRRIDAHPVDPKDGLGPALADGAFARVWLALHGRGGEDGTVQGALEHLRVPYTGSGVLGSAVGIDKQRSKQMIEAAGLGTPVYAVLREDDDPALAAEVPMPLAVKPAHEGSGIGVSHVASADALGAAVIRARKHDRTVVVEHWVDGDEFTAGVINGVALPLVRVESSPERFSSVPDRSAKPVHVCPCGLSDDRETALRAQALAAFNAVGARGWGGVDFRLSDSGEPLFLEVNTLPAMTPGAPLPLAAAEAGCDFGELCWRVLETSLVDVAAAGMGR